MAKETKIFDSDIKYTVDYRDISYPRLEFRKGELELILPLSHKDEKKILEKHKRWIREKNKLIQIAVTRSNGKKLKERSLINLRKLIVKIINKENSDKKLRIAFRTMKSKWGSCSSSQNLTFNTLLRYMPDSLVKYVVIHELTHLTERRHTSYFWNLVGKKFPDYKLKEKNLFVYWFLIQNKISFKN